MRVTPARVLLFLILIPAPVTWAEETRPGRKRSTLERMTPDRLAAASADVAKLASQRRAVPPLPGLIDFKGIFHAHAEDSSHTGGTRSELLADAQRAGVSFVFLANHYRPPLDFITQTWRGLREGVLFVPGSETHGFLIHPTASVMERMSEPKDDLVGAVAANGGSLFLSHVEERRDHPMDGLTGMEIYNRHYDAMDDADSMRGIAEMMTDPESLRRLEASLRLFPDAMLAAQLDYPALYLEKWDRETRARRVVGIAANDCHHNQEFVLKAAGEGSVRLGTIVDKDSGMRLITATQRPKIAELLRGRKSGDLIARLDFDPYYRSMFNVSTHVLAPELSENAIRQAVANGRVYVSHDWMGDPAGFLWVAIENGKPAALLGDELPHRAGLALTAELPLPARIRILRDGVEWKTGQGTRLEAIATEKGVYRAEAWLNIDGEDRPWIYSNPIYLR